MLILKLFKSELPIGIVTCKLWQRWPDRCYYPTNSYKTSPPPVINRISDQTLSQGAALELLTKLVNISKKTSEQRLSGHIIFSDIYSSGINWHPGERVEIYIDDDNSFYPRNVKVIKEEDNSTVELGDDLTKLSDVKEWRRPVI